MSGQAVLDTPLALDLPDAMPVSRTFVSQRLQLHYLDWGKPAGRPDAPVLILVHGGQDHAHNWDWLAGQLRQDWHVIAPDLRGHGESAWSPEGNYAYSAYVYDLAQLVHLCGNGPVTIVGHSLGGVIAVRYAAIYPERVRRLVTLEGLSMDPWLPALENGGPIIERIRGWIEDQRALAPRVPRRFATFEDALAQMRKANAQLSEAQVLHLARNGTRRNEDDTWSWCFDDYTRKTTMIDMSRPEERQLYAAITCPVLILRGEASWFPNPGEDGQAGFFRDAAVVSLPDAGHWMHHDRPREALAAIAEFIAP